MKHRGQQIKTLEDLAAARDQKRAVIGEAYPVSHHLPAVVVMNMPATVVYEFIKVGLYIYKK